jgi:hypothetical protein
MLGIYNNRKPFYNKTMMEYSRKSTEESIKKMVEREKNKKIIGLKSSDSQVLSNTSGIAFFTILSISSFIYYFLNAKK